MRKRDLFVAPMEDMGAKQMFQDETVRKYFISAVLEIPVEEIRSARLTSTNLLRRWRKDKEGIMDISVELNDDSVIIIEVQVAEYKHWDKRNLYYLARKYTDGMESGEDYTKLKRSISICVLDFNFLKTEKCHSKFLFRDEDGNVYTDVMEIHIVEINKATQADKAINEWIKLFRCRSEEELTMLETKNPGIKIAIEQLKQMSLRRAIREEREYRLKQRRDRNAREEFVYDKGKTEGKLEGKLEGKIEAVDNLRGNLKLDLDTACHMIGITAKEYHDAKSDR